MRNILFGFVLTLFFIGCTVDSQGVFDQTGGEVAQGSYATMLTIGNKLYVVNSQSLTTFDVTKANQPVKLDEQNVGFEIESIYHYDGVLLIGSSTFMHIFVLKDGIPVRESSTKYNTITGCSYDPIVTKGNFAYVTLSTTLTNSCGRNEQVNELRVYDISDLASPKLITAQQMSEPKGLGVDGDLLFVCDNKTGLVVYDIKDVKKPVKFKEFTGFSAYDVIARNGLLLVSAKNKLLQYNYTNPSDIKLIATIDL